MIYSDIFYMREVVKYTQYIFLPFVVKKI